ncbi:zf-TFIIB domain-containing protein [Caballeronia sp. LZ065]|uniref:TFIIB-type zinc ribbon-containing protein n=1 Tax=Caballeronia sp. LZ065 TaxID=3038571 RepID=UPI002863B3E2|nr:zf-TFIIB domain-containing protein [Caballeronia sp. LZ065]MDR5779476.1 zf-TFIIB domain-containing protein [Caballeronia sp. LZ065]
MKCPVCPANDLLMSVREGIEIDYCPQCRGVWLDRGELDQLIRRAEQASLAEVKTERDEWRREQEHGRERRPLRGDETRHDDHRYVDPRNGREHPRRKKSFLGELFDFD